MKLKLLSLAAVLLLAGSTANAASLVVGFDFSQALAPGTPTCDGTTLCDIVNGNWSDLDMVSIQGIGEQGSAAFGNIDLTAGLAGGLFGFQTPNLLSGNTSAFGTMGNPSSQAQLQNDGQPFWSQVSLLSSGAVSAIVDADLSSIAGTGTNWSLSFAALGGANASVIDVLVGGVSQGQINVAAGIEDVYTLALGALNGLAGGAIELAFDGNPVNIDNVSILADVSTVPEPGTLAMLLSGLAGLTWAGRRRA